MKRYLSSANKFVILLGFFLITPTSKSSCQTNLSKIGKHHVIVLIDRSAGMQPKNKGELRQVFDSLNEVCFNEVYDNVERQLLIPKHDYLSIVSFGLYDDPKETDDMDDYIQIEDSFDKCGQIKFGDYYKKEFDEEIFNILYDNILRCGIRGNIGKKESSSFFNLNVGYPSKSLVLSIDHIGKKYKSQEYNRTFVVSITDNAPNPGSDESYDFELDEDAEAVELKVKGIFNNFKKYFTLKDLETNINIERVINHSYQKDNYHVDVFEVIPINQPIIYGLLDISLPLTLFRYTDKYKGELTIKDKGKGNKDFGIKDLFVSYEKNGIWEKSKLIKDELNIYTSYIEIEKYKAKDSLVAEISIATHYNNDVYPGMEIHSDPPMKIIVKFEEKAKILGFIPMGDSICCFFGSQQKTKVFWDIIFLILILTLILFLFISYIRMLARKTYPVSQSQFKST